MELFRRRARSSQQLKRELKKKARRYRYRWVRRAFYVTVSFTIIGISYLTYDTLRDLPQLNTVFKSVSSTKLFDHQVTVKYLNSDNQVFYQDSNTPMQAVKVTEIKAMPNVVNALVSIEDRNYFKEGGVNWLASVKAGFKTLTSKEVVGGSTLTQQLIKLSFFSTKRSDQTVHRKLQEMVLATQLSKKYSKDQILTWYLNRTNYSNAQVGIKTAAWYYYQKLPQQLSIDQAAMLVGIVNSPTSYNPYLAPKLTKERRDLVLWSMYQNHKLTKKQYLQLVKVPIEHGIVQPTEKARQLKVQMAKRLEYDGFVTAANSQLSKYDSRFLKQSVTIKTTMNQALQNKVNRIVANADFADNQMQEGLVVLDNQTGNVVAMSGGRHQNVISGYNRAYNLNRSSGSSIKPLLDYAPGFDELGYTANDIVYDTPYTYPNSNQYVHDWDNSYQGPITLRQALVQSRNIPAVRSLARIGLNKGNQALMALGLNSVTKPIYYPDAIGINTSPFAMATAYSSLANDGVKVNGRFVQSLYNPVNHKTLLLSPVTNRVFKSSTSSDLTDVLHGVFYGNGTATAAQIPGLYQAGKTGTVGRTDTANGLTDAWMVGYTKHYTVAVWVGYDNPYSPQILTDQKAQVAQLIYKRIMQATQKYSYRKKTLSGSGNFLRAKAQQNARLPFYLNMSPDQFLGTNNVNLTVLDDLYNQVNRKEW